MTLLDYPGKIAATVFLSGCNFRCPYCHNASLLTATAPPVMTEDEFFAFLHKRQGLLDGVCVSGGEPLLHAELALFLSKIKALGFAVKLDTNGSYPAALITLVEQGLIDYVAMDIKNAPAKYAQTAGIPADILPAIRKSIDYLLGSPVDYEFRTTVVDGLHTVEDIAEIGKLIQGAKKYFLQNFEDSGDVLTSDLQGVQPLQIEAFAKAARAFIPVVQVRNP